MALHLASQQGHVEVAELLLKYGSTVDVKQTKVFMSCRYRQSNCI